MPSLVNNFRRSKVWWHMPKIPGLGRLREEKCQFKVSLEHTV
jgi:hypothetical protein